VPTEPEYLQPPHRVDGTILLADADPRWPQVYDEVAARIQGALGEQVRLLEHAGSNSVPGLAAKPVIDVLLAVDDPSDEATYVDALQAAGFRLHMREPDWHEHRLFKGVDPAVNLHVFGVGSDEITRMQRFRDHLRRHPDDRALYEQTKRELAARSWGTVQDYADAKTAVVTAIMARAMA